jgi:thymidylate synthase ThyX
MIEDYEEFTEGQKRVLGRYVSNTHRNVFVLRNLPEVIKGALFSRYSRSTLGLRTLLLKDFILNEETAFSSIAIGTHVSDEEGFEDQLIAIRKAQNFYDRILDGYGDDSIGELGGAHLAIEQISMIAAKAVEDCRIGGSPLEKSTRYIYFDQKIKGEYLFYREPILMTSAYRDLYVDTCNTLFETYSELIPQMTDLMEEQFPKDPEVAKSAYKAAIRAKVLDCLRGLLPASTLTNMGIYGNGRFYEGLLHKLHCHPLAELQDVGIKAYDELSQVIPSFVRRANPEHRHHKSYAEYFETVHEELELLVEQQLGHMKPADHHNYEPGVRLVDWTPDPTVRVASAILYAGSGRALTELRDYCLARSPEELDRILDIGCDVRENRRQKSSRALEHITFTFEIVADFGVYRDLHRHRMLTQERHLLSCHYGYYTPNEVVGTSMEQPYREAIERAKEAYDTIEREFPEESQYIVPMACNVPWYFVVNLRSLQWLTELRSQPAGHPSYRYVAQEMARQVTEAIPQFERYFKFVDYDGHELGRLGQEQRKAERAERLEREGDK